MSCPFKCRSCGKKTVCKATNPKKVIMPNQIQTCDEEFEDCVLYRLRMRIDE